MFYTYLWLRQDGSPYYIGKGSSDRAFVSDGHGVHKPVSEYRILVQEFETEADAFFAEKFLISFYGRKDRGDGCLRNMTDGGEGVSGHIYTEDQLKRRAELSRRRVWTETSRQKMREIAKSRPPISEETRKRMSKSSIGRPSGNKGKIASLETREKQRLAKLGRKRLYDKSGNWTTVRQVNENQCGSAAS